jgi:hypothetical protein
MPVPQDCVRPRFRIAFSPTIVVFSIRVERVILCDMPADPSAEYQKLADELSELSKLQSQALQASAYVLMNAQEAQQYDARRIRIGELCECLGRFNPPSR